MRNQPFFSIIIPTLNEADYLPQLLLDLEQQTMTDFEVIHIDGNSEDTTVAKAAEFSKKINLTTKKVSKRNVSFQRNKGGQLAKGKWLIFMDADNRLPKYFLQGVRYQIDKHEVTDAVDIFTTWVTIPKNRLFNRAVENSINVTFEFYNRIGKSAGFGAMIGVRSSIFKDISFDEETDFFEDVLFIQDVVKHDFEYKLFREPRFIYSTRRLEKEGNLKLARTAAQAQLHYLFGNNEFNAENFGYVMKGGAYYSQARGTFLENMQHLIENSSKEQLEKIKAFFKRFNL